MGYPIGKAGQPWGQEEKSLWLSNQEVKRSYQEQVVNKVQILQLELAELIEVHTYGALSIEPQKYPLYLIKSKQWQEDKPTFMVTGGVHGYETSGVQGALLFVRTQLQQYADKFNFIVFPCVSPWGYETINRWNPLAIDPNRSFYENSPSEEARFVMSYLAENNITPICHIDLHETTDTDNSEFRPALAARDAIEQKTWNIPDGFYGVGDTARPEPEFQKAIIDSVQQVTHIAPADENGELIGVPLEQFGVINYDKKPLALCGGVTDAQFVSTTEVYPDSPLVDDDNCNVAQVAAIVGALNFLISNGIASSLEDI